VWRFLYECYITLVQLVAKVEVVDHTKSPLTLPYVLLALISCIRLAFVVVLFLFVCAFCLSLSQIDSQMQISGNE